MSNQKDFSNPDMKEIVFESNKAQTPAEKGAKTAVTGKKVATEKKNTSVAGKKGFFSRMKKETLKKKPQEGGLSVDPLNDLELIDLMDDDALERLAEKDWDRYMAIAEAHKPETAVAAESGKAKPAEKAPASADEKAKLKASATGTVPAGTGDKARVFADKKSAPKVSSVKRGYRSFSRIRVSLVAITVLVCLLAGIAAGRMLIIKQRLDVINSFVGIGAELTEVDVIGQQGLNVVSEEHRQAAADNERKKKEKEQEQKEELEEKDRVQVELVCQTIMGDLKIKFVNVETGRIIAGVPFSADITGPDGKTVTHVNNDKDGIIYLSPVPAGNYTITMGKIPTGDKFKKYVQATKSGYVTVSDTITYDVVDVTDEVVTEAEAPNEQKVVNDIVEENVLQDTVAFVESTKTLISGGENYVKISKDQIDIPTSPQTKGYITGDFVFMSSNDTPATGVSVEENPTTDKSSTTATDESQNASSKTTGSAASSTSGTAGNAASSASSAQTPAEKKYEAWITHCPTQMKVGETVDVSVSTNLTNPKFSGIVTAGYSTDVSFAAPSVTGSDAVVKLEAKKEGTVSIQFHVNGVDDDGKIYPTIPTAECTIIILPGDGITEKPAEGTINKSQKITTKDKKDVYVEESGKYIPATYGDFLANKDLYIRSDEKAVYKYTGWQSIDGCSYYYTADGQPVTGEQIIRGVKYTFGPSGVLSTDGTNMGIDVSAHQGAIDWAAVKSAGVSFAIIRVGFRGYETGRLVEDSCFRQNLQGAISNGIRVGVYVFSAAVNEVEAVEEASLAINLIRGYNITYPVYIDIESSGTGSGRADRLDVGTRTAVAHAFCQTVAAAGYMPGVYANTTWFNSYMNTPQLTGYSIWLAQYNTTVTYTRTKYDIWQYSSKGSIPGINTRVDMNIGYTPY